MIYTYSMQKDLAEVKALLSTVPLLSALGEEELLSLAGEFSTLALKAGQSLYTVGDPTDGLYLLARGKMQCLQAGEPPKAAILTAGEWIGEESLQGEPQRLCSASALSDCTLFFLDNLQVKELLLEHPEVHETYKVLLKSRKMAERIPLTWLQPNEHIFLMTRKHPVFLLLNVLWPILTFGLVMVLLVLFAQQWAGIAAVVLTGAFTLCGLWLAWNINNWANDFYIITNKRLVWVEHVSGLCDSRQEAPLGTLLSVGIQKTVMGAIFGYADIVVRTYVGNIRFNRVGDAPIIGKLIEVYWKKSKIGDREEEAETMRAALRRKLGGEAEAPAEKEMIIEPPLEVETPQPAEKNFFQWLFQDFLRIHVEDEHIITYRKHWLVLLRMSLLPLIGLIISLSFLIGMVTWNFSDIPYQLGVMIGFLLTVFMLCWLVYRYIDWRDDVFQLTPTQVIDIDRKPFGRLSRRSAPLENILSIEYERKGIFQMLFNFGTVYITVGNTQLTFNEISRPADVQQQIFARMGAHAEELRQREIDEERERMTEWFKVYHEESQSKDTTKQLRTPPP